MYLSLFNVGTKEALFSVVVKEEEGDAQQVAPVSDGQSELKDLTVTMTTTFNTGVESGHIFSS